MILTKTLRSVPPIRIRYSSTTKGGEHQTAGLHCTVFTGAHQSSLPWATRNPVHTLTLTYFRIARERRKERTLKWSLPLRISAKIMYAFFNSPTFTTFPFHPSTLMMNCTNYDNYHNTVCYFLLLLIPFMFQHYTQHPALKHTQNTSHSSFIKTKSGCLWRVHKMTDFH